LDGESTLLRARDQGPSCLRRLERRPHIPRQDSPWRRRRRSADREHEWPLDHV